ncbi:sigma-70 family RNA polymerase sigma factor [Enhygromyxa salina]|uniref:RNA polymerase sigma factor n=1 Tax=Enhygromyxa salina TaxID=215803 RepID=A0A2S9XT73_9BACT|nr:sigma-70 family RNA polymerase sigma factor [Enhygromyxa salina]PRP96055.1 RNA polymerase sigma factor [Enhygromyxa salina]
MSITRQLCVGPAEFAALNRQLVAFFRRRGPVTCDPSDLAADTWIAVVRWYRGECSLRHFAFVVARGMVSAAWRKRRIITTSASDEELGDSATAEGPSLDSLLMLAAQHEAMERALEDVTDPYRDALVLWLEGLDNYQIAAELDIAYNTVRSRMSRGKAQLLAAIVGTVEDEIS